MKMIPILQLCGVSFVAVVSAAYAQQPVPAAAPATLDSSTRDVVTKFSIRSGKIALSSAANPGPAYLPDGTYTNDDNTIIVILDGRIVRIQTSSGTITEISLSRQSSLRGIMLTPSTNALMAVSEIRLPSGTFKSEDGASLTVVAGRPKAFRLSTLPKTR